MNSQNDLLLSSLTQFYQNEEHLAKMLNIINGNSKISLRIVDWFSTNYSKKNYTTLELPNGERFKVYNDYKLKLKAYSKKRFDPFCRWERINMPIGDREYSLMTTIGQLNFFKWAIENKIIQFIEENYTLIEQDMNHHNSLSKAKKHNDSVENLKTARKRREELSVCASKSLKKENVSVVVSLTATSSN
jgi:hypothetical protein